jgi:hypothetical protein
MANVSIMLLLNVFFLAFLPNLATNNSNGFLSTIYFENFQVGYIFISNLVASFVTLMVLIPNYTSISWKFDVVLWKKMMTYGLPILFAGIAFAINEHFDKILLDWMHVPLVIKLGCLWYFSELLIVWALNRFFLVMLAMKTHNILMRL